MLFYLLFQENPDAGEDRATRASLGCPAQWVSHTPSAVADVQAILADQAWDLIVWDCALSCCTPDQAVAQIQARQPGCPILLVADGPTQRQTVTWMRLGVQGVVDRANPDHFALLIRQEQEARGQGQATHPEPQRAKGLAGPWEQPSDFTHHMLEQASRMARIGIFVRDLVNNTLHWSPIMKELMEVPPEFEPSWSDVPRFYGLDGTLEILSEVTERTIETGEPYDVELPVMTGRGNRRWMRGIGRVEYEDGQPVRLYGTLMDTTERKELELNLSQTNQQLTRQMTAHTQELARTHESLAAIFNHSGDGILLLDLTENREHQANQTLFDMFGLPRDLPLNSQLLSNFPAETVGRFCHDVQSVAVAGQSQRVEFSITRMDGREIVVEVSIAPISLHGEPANQLVCILRDVTERRRVEAALQASEAKFRTLADWTSDWELC